MSKYIWHKKTEQPKKLLHCTRLIITKWGSVYSEKDIDNGAFIETDWAYLDDLLSLETELERTRKALELAITGLKNCKTRDHIGAVCRTPEYVDKILEQITAEQKD